MYVFRIRILFRVSTRVESTPQACVSSQQTPWRLAEIKHVTKTNSSKMYGIPMKSKILSHSPLQISSGATLPLPVFLKHPLAVLTTTPLISPSSFGARVPQNGTDGAGRGDSRSFILETVSRLCHASCPVVNSKKNEYIIRQDKRRRILPLIIPSQIPVTCLTLSAARLLCFLMDGWRTTLRAPSLSLSIARTTKKSRQCVTFREDNKPRRPSPRLQNDRHRYTPNASAEQVPDSRMADPASTFPSEKARRAGLVCSRSARRRGRSPPPQPIGHLERHEPG